MILLRSFFKLLTLFVFLFAPIPTLVYATEATFTVSGDAFTIEEWNYIRDELINAGVTPDQFPNFWQVKVKTELNDLARRRQDTAHKLDEAKRNLKYAVAPNDIANSKAEVDIALAEQKHLEGMIVDVDAILVKLELSKNDELRKAIAEAFRKIDTQREAKKPTDTASQKQKTSDRFVEYQLNLAEKGDFAKLSVQWKAAQEAGQATATYYTYGAFMKTPLTSKQDTENSLTVYPDDRKWYFGLVLGKRTEDSSDFSVLDHVFELGGNYQPYPYNPDGGTDKKTDWKLSYTASWNILSNYRELTASYRMAPQLLLKYSESYKAANQVGYVVTPSSGGTLYVENRVPKAPQTIPTFSARLASVFDLGMSPLALGAEYQWYNSSGDGSAFSDSQKLTMELWFHYYPSTENAKSLNIGENQRLQYGISWQRVLKHPSLTGEESAIMVMIQLRSDIKSYQY